MSNARAGGLAAGIAITLAVGGAGCSSSSATCQEFCHHYYGDCMLTGYLGSSSAADCEMRCGDQADAGACRNYGGMLGCLNSLPCSQLDLSTADATLENLGRYQLCDARGGCNSDGG